MPNSKLNNVRTLKPSQGLIETLAHHDARLGAFDSRLVSLEKGFGDLSGEVHGGFSSTNAALSEVKTALAQLNVRPSFDLQKIATTTLVVATLLSMCIGTIVWVNVLQTSAIVAKVEGQQALVTWRLEQAEKDIRYLGRRINEKGE